MGTRSINDYTRADAIEYIEKNVDSIVVADGEKDTYRALVRKGFFTDFIEESGSYHDFMEKLWFHFNNSDEKITDQYHVFLPKVGEFVSKYSKRTKVVFENITHIIQMTIYPIEGENQYLFYLDEIDDKEYIEEDMTTDKVKSIQNTYLFSMYVDLMNDTTNSVSITEIDDETMNTQIKYSEWREQIVDMISKEYQDLFRKRTSPEYLKSNLAPGSTSSFDCLMMNLEGKYIWVKLIFSRAETDNDDDYRFVFMVQNIHESTMELKNTIKKYEEMALRDPLTSVFNRGRIETEVINAIKKKKTNEIDISMMILDIDFFKRVNDEFGHSVGDITLIHFTETLTKVVEKYNAVIGRWGGEEFVVVCYGADTAKVAAMAEEIRGRIAEEDFLRVGHITCSIGTTTLRSNDELSIAFDRMDRAVYEAKSSGRNCVRSVNYL